MKERVLSKYQILNNVNSFCQYARQIRNSVGYSKINVTVTNCDEPIWNGLNLKLNNGMDIYSIMTILQLQFQELPTIESNLKNFRV